MERVARIATKRERSLFAQDIACVDNALRDAIKGKRILAVGAAGSIGSSTVHVLARYAPAALHVVDQNRLH